MHKLNDPLRWFGAPACFVVAALLLMLPLGLLFGGAKDPKESTSAITAGLMLLAAVGTPASLYLCTSLVLSRINALIQAVESLTPRNHPAAPIETVAVTTVKDEPLSDEGRNCGVARNAEIPNFRRLSRYPDGQS